MKKTYSTKSWHYRLATKYANFDTYDRTTNICTYIKSVIGGLIATIIIAFALAAILALCGAPILWFTAGILNGFVEPNSATVIGMMIWSVSLFCGIAGILLKYVIPKLHMPKTNILSDNFIIHSYQSISKQLCFSIEFLEKMEELKTIPHTVIVSLSTGESFETDIPVGEVLPEELYNYAEYIHDSTSGNMIKSKYPIGSYEYHKIVDDLGWSRSFYDWNTVLLLYIDKEHNRLSCRYNSDE